MPTTDEIRQALGLPRNMKTRQVLNRALRECVPGGSELLTKLERLDDQRVSEPRNPHFAAEVGKLLAQRDQLVEDIRAGRIPLRGREGHA